MRRKLSRLPAARALASAVSTTSYGGAATRLTSSRGGRRARNGRINATRTLFHANGHGPESGLEPGFADRSCGPPDVRRQIPTAFDQGARARRSDAAAIRKNACASADVPEWSKCGAPHFDHSGTV